MKSRIPSLPAFLLLGMLVLAACGGAGAPATIEEPAPAEAPADISPQQPVAQSGADSESTLKQGPVYETGGNVIVALTNRLIIKNADMRLLVEDSDQAIDRLTQVVDDSGGYIVSSRVWYQSHLDEENYKFATITMGVPADQFERVLNRLRGISLKVLDETASGEDVTDQYVDLQSQLANLEATRDRVKSFLDDAKNVDEALRINQQLSDIEGQIEEIKGRINYLKDRSAYSTITVNIEPQLPDVEPEPAPAPVWRPGKTVESAWRALTRAYQIIIDLLIWILLVFVPIFAPPALILWLVYRFIFRKPKKPSS